MNAHGLETICVETGFSQRYGLNSMNCRVGNIDEIEEVYSGRRKGRFLVILDVFHDRINSLINIVKLRGSSKITFALKPCLSRRYFRRFLRNPIDKITGVEYSIGFYIDSISGNTRETHRSYIKLRFDDYLRIFTIRSPKTLGLIINKSLRMLKFLIVGISGYVANLVSAHLLMGSLGKIVSRAQASILVALVSIEVSISWNYILHERWTFRDVPRFKSLRAYLKRWFEYHIVSLGSIVSQTLCVYFMTGLLNKPLTLSITIGVLLGFFLNYILSKKLVWGSSVEYR